MPAADGRSAGSRKDQHATAFEVDFGLACIAVNSSRRQRLKRGRFTMKIQLFALRPFEPSHRRMGLAILGQWLIVADDRGL
jgi:hypothetical protein